MSSDSPFVSLRKPGGEDRHCKCLREEHQHENDRRLDFWKRTKASRANKILVEELDGLDQSIPNSECNDTPVDRRKGQRKLDRNDSPIEAME